jgi:hypothetical protein
VDPAKV